MIARCLRPDDVILWLPDPQWWWVKTSRTVDPDDSVDGPWRLITEQLTGMAPGLVRIRAEDVHPERDFPLVEVDP